MAQQRKRTAGDDLRDFKAGKISGNFYHNGIDRSDNYIQHTSAPRYITDENGKTQVASYNEWIQQEVFQHQHDLPNDTSSTSSNNKTATNDISVKSSNNTSSSAGSDIKSFLNGNLNKANSSAENFREAIKNPNKPLDDRVKGLTYMYNAAVATGDTKTAEKMQKEYDELADRVNKQTEINRQNAKEYAHSQSLKGMTDERKALVDERNKYALDNGLVTSTGIDTRKKDKYKVYSEYSSKIDELDKQIAEKQRNGEYDLSDSQKAVLADIGDKANKLTESFENKYKNSTLEQRLNARLHATTSELNWLNKHMYDNSSSKELEEYNNQLNKEANSLWNQRDEEQAYNRLKAIEDEQGKLKTAIDNAKLSEQKKKEYDDIVNNDIKAKTVLQKYYALQEYSSNQSLVRSEENTDGAKNQVILDDYNYINKLSVKERNQIVKDFNNLKKEGYDTESLYKWYKRERDAESAAETTRVYTDYADKHPVLGSLQSVGVRLTGAVPDAVKYISTDLDKKYNGGDGYINPEETGTAISDAMRAKVSENINNDFGSFLYNTGMSMADFASLLPLNAVPGGQALSLGIMGTSAGVGAANEVINNGGTIDNAVKTGIAAGIAETLFEKVSLEQLSAFKASGKSTFRAAVGNVLKGAFTEGSEEAFTDLANRLTDDAINKDLSSYNLAKKNYMEQGMNEAEAENAASWDFWKNVGLDFAGGAISGGVLNLATAGINLAGAKIDMAQNKESNAQIGKAVMADENFDLDLLIRQGLATEKNDKAYNYAKHMQKLVETDNEGKISAGDVGNLMYLINREVAKNPELVNKIAQVKKQDTQEQGNKTVNVQNEQSPTQQNTVQNVQDTAQNGQQNAEQAQASTAINATKKADTEAIGKMYGAYAFGKKHPNGIIATDTSTGKVVKVALKSLESSSKINRSDEENTLIFNTNDGKQVNADSITFSDSQLDAVVHSANEFDTYGARNYISNFEEWRESPQAQKMSDEEMLYKYNKAYSAAYSFGREGVKLDSLRETSEYTILKNILGEQIVSQALSTGRRDVDINTQHHANRLTELINRNGRADTSGVSVYADSGTDVSHISQELINTLGNLATKTGRNIIISDRLADGVNGVARDGNIILSSEISSQKILATALHEAGHMIKKTNPTEWQTLSDFVADYLVRKGVDLNKMIDRTIERYGNRLQADEHENTRDAALEEIVCDTLMSIASDEKALNIALRTKQNKAKIAAAIKSLITKVKDWLISKSTNYGAKTFAKDLEALENLAQRFSEAADTAKENITEQTEVQNGEKIDVEKFSVEYTDDNKPVVVITDNILKGVPKKDWITTVKKTISNKFKNGIPIKGRLIKVNKDTGNEYTNSSYTQRIRSTNSTVYKNKLKAANNLDEIIISSTNYINEALNHPRKDNIKQFARGNVLMEIGNNQYRAEVIIGYTGGNNMLLYDLINLKSTSFTIKKADASTAQQKTNSEDSRLNASATNIISQNSNNVNEKFSLDEDTDEKAGAIHDTLNFSIDDEYDDWLVNDDGKSVFDAIKDEKNPDRRISILYHYAGKTAEHGMRVGKDIRIGQSGMHRLVCNVLQEYGVNLNGKNKSRIEAFKSVVNDFENSVKNDTQSFNDAIESLAEECKEYLKKSSLIDKKHSEWAKDLSDSLKEVTLVIPKGDIDFIKSAYGSITNFRKALMGKINIRTAKGYALIESVNEGSIEDVGNSISEIIGDIAGIDETFNWRSEEGYKTLERFINYDLAEHFVSIDGKSVQSIDETSIEMAFGVATEYLKQQAKEVVLDNNANKELLHSITEIYNQANEEHELLLKEKNARYAEQISEQKKNAEKQIKSLVRKNNKKTEQYIKNDIKLRNKIKSDAKEYRITLRATKKTVAEEYRAERDKTKYRQKISTTLERLINRHLKPKPSNNVPISVVKPLYRLLSELTGNYSGFSKGVNDITEKTGYNKTDNQEGERVNKVTLSAETEKLISALNSEIANTDGKITLPPAMRNALLGYNVFDNKGNIKQHFTGLLEDVRNIFEKAEKNGKTSLKDFSLSELKRISTAFSEVKKLLDAANKIVINGKEYDAYLVSRKGAEELKKVTGTHKKGSNTQASTAKRTLLAYRKYMSDPIRFARMISGYHNDSVIVQLMDMLNQGQSDAEQLSIDWTNKYEEQMSRFSYKAKKDYVREQAMEFDGIDPNTKEELVDKKTGEQVKVGLTADMLVEMLLEYEDEYGRAHMMYSGYQVPNIKYIKRKNQQLMYSKDSGCYILPTESDISRIRDYVMNNEIAKTVYEICREMYNEDMQNAVNKVSNEKYGYEIAKVKNYCPITIDEDTVYGTFADVLINRSINSRAFLHERENFKYNRLKLKGATAKLTSQIKSVSSWCGLTMPIETFNRVFNMPRYDHKNDSLVKAVQEENLNSAENIRQKNNTHADEEEKSKLSIDEHFTDKYDEWDKKGGRFSFRVGTTSEVLQRLGVDDKNIWWDTSKILKIKNKHPEMTDDILKQVPNVLESPIIVMESYTVKGRLVLFGDVYDAKNNPVLVALELNPIGEGGKSLDIIKIASAYGKDSNLQHMIDKSNILYVEPNEKRTHTWLTGNGLQLPLPSSKYGFSDNIKSQNQGDVKYSVEKEAHSTLSIDEVLDFIEREEKQKKKKESTSTTEYFPSMKEIMKQQWGNESEEYISKLMGDLQGSTKQADPGRIDMLTGKYIRAVLTANISSAIKQLSSYPLAAARVGWKATLAGLKHIRPGKHTPFLNRALPDSYKQSIPYDEIAKYTPILEYRKQGNNSREMAEISRYKGLIDSSGWVGHTLDRLNWIEKNDVLMVEMNYWIAYEHVKGNMGISPDSKEFMPNVAKTLEDIINNMMPNSSVMQQGQILRSKNPVNRIFTICKSQVFCMVNAAMDASGEYNARLKDYKQAVSESEKKQARTEVKIAKKQLARTYSAIIVSTAMTCGILMPLIAALFGKWDRYRDEDGNITPWSVGSRLLKDFGSELTGMFLFGDTVYNTVLALIDKNEEFYGLSLPGVDTINDFITGIINIARSDTPEKLRKNISSLVGTLGMLTGLPTKNLMNLFQGACNHIENFTKYGGTPTVNDYGEVSMQMYANYCYEALIDGDKKKFAKLYSEWLKGKTSTGKQVDKSYINSKLKTELEDDTEIIAAGNAFFNGDLTAYENTVEKYSDLGFDKTTVVKAINSIVSDLEDEQKNAEGLDKYDNEEESDSKPELYKYSDAFDFLKNGDTANYEKVEKYLMEHKGKTKNQMKKLMQSASRTDPMFEQYISASKSNDADTTHTLYRQLLNVYGSESRFKSALRKYQDKIKKRQGK